MPRKYSFIIMPITHPQPAAGGGMGSSPDTPSSPDDTSMPWLVQAAANCHAPPPAFAFLPESTDVRDTHKTFRCLEFRELDSMAYRVTGSLPIILRNICAQMRTYTDDPSLPHAKVLNALIDPIGLRTLLTADARTPSKQFMDVWREIIAHLDTLSAELTTHGSAFIRLLSEVDSNRIFCDLALTAELTERGADHVEIRRIIDTAIAASEDEIAFLQEANRAGAAEFHPLMSPTAELHVQAPFEKQTLFAQYQSHFLKMHVFKSKHTAALNMLAGFTAYLEDENRLLRDGSIYAVDHWMPILQNAIVTTDHLLKNLLSISEEVGGGAPFTPIDVERIVHACKASLTEYRDRLAAFVAMEDSTARLANAQEYQKIAQEKFKALRAVAEENRACEVEEPVDRERERVLQAIEALGPWDTLTPEQKAQAREMAASLTKPALERAATYDYLKKPADPKSALTARRGGRKGSVYIPPPLPISPAFLETAVVPDEAITYLLAAGQFSVRTLVYQLKTLMLRTTRMYIDSLTKFTPVAVEHSTDSLSVALAARAEMHHAKIRRLQEKITNLRKKRHQIFEYEQYLSRHAPTTRRAAAAAAAAAYSDEAAGSYPELIHLLHRVKLRTLTQAELDASEVTDPILRRRAQEKLWWEVSDCLIPQEVIESTAYENLVICINHIVERCRQLQHLLALMRQIRKVRPDDGARLPSRLVSAISHTVRRTPTREEMRIYDENTTIFLDGTRPTGLHPTGSPDAIPGMVEILQEFMQNFRDIQPLFVDRAAHPTKVPCFVLMADNPEISVQPVDGRVQIAVSVRNYVSNEIAAICMAHVHQLLRFPNRRFTYVHLEATGSVLEAGAIARKLDREIWNEFVSPAGAAAPQINFQTDQFGLQIILCVGRHLVAAQIIRDTDPTAQARFIIVDSSAIRTWCPAFVSGIQQFCRAHGLRVFYVNESQIGPNCVFHTIEALYWLSNAISAIAYRDSMLVGRTVSYHALFDDLFVYLRKLSGRQAFEAAGAAAGLQSLALHTTAIMGMFHNLQFGLRYKWARFAQNTLTASAFLSTAAGSIIAQTVHSVIIDPRLLERCRATAMVGLDFATAFAPPGAPALTAAAAAAAAPIALPPQAPRTHILRGHPLWQEDRSVNSCQSCGKPFKGFLLSSKTKVHCSNCGHIVCENCAKECRGCKNSVCESCMAPPLKVFCKICRLRA